MQTNQPACPYSLAKITWPIFIELILQLLVGNMDQLMLSRYNATAVAAVGNANQIITILVLAFTVINLAATILISRSLGAQNLRSASQIYTLSVLLNLLLGVILCLAVVLGGRHILLAMQVQEELLPQAHAYLVITGLSLPFHALMLTFSAFLRAHAHMKTIMLATGLTNLVNVAGNAAFIYGLGPFLQLGAAGAALSTALCRVLGMVLLWWAFYRSVQGPKLSLSCLSPFPHKLLGQLLGIGLPSGGENLSYNFSQMASLVFVNGLGTYVVTTRMYCNMLAQVCYLLVLAVAQAGQIMVSYCMGAGQFLQAQRICSRILKIFTPLTMGITTLFCFAAPAVFGLLSADARVAALGQKVLAVEIFLELGRCFNIVLVRNLQAVGDVKFPVTVGIASQWIIAVGLCWILGIYCGFGLVGMWVAFALDENLRAVIFWLRWKKGGWKKQAVC